MCAVNSDAYAKQAGWLLLVVLVVVLLVVVLLVATGAAMLMVQAHLGLRGVQQAHQALQNEVDQWPPLLISREPHNGE
jgi:hypothetical protein